MHLDMKLIDQLLVRDPFLKPYEAVLHRRIKKITHMERRLTQGRMALVDFASGHEYFGLHYKNNQWIFREWAPSATAIFLIGEMTDWQEKRAFSLDSHCPPGKTTLIEVIGNKGDLSC